MGRCTIYSQNKVERFINFNFIEALYKIKIQNRVTRGRDTARIFLKLFFMHDGIDQIIEERHKHFIKERTIAKDVAFNSNNELISAIMMLAAKIGFNRTGQLMPNEAFNDLRPETWDKGKCLKYVQRAEIEQLKMIGAFAAAEIDRLQNS